MALAKSHSERPPSCFAAASRSKDLTNGYDLMLSDLFFWLVLTLLRGQELSCRRQIAALALLHRENRLERLSQLRGDLDLTLALVCGFRENRSERHRECADDELFAAS